MKLHIENLGKIAVADFNFNGITLIVGDNNTGKSTAGKTLFATFNALYDFTDRIFRDRFDACRRALRSVVRSFPRSYGGDDPKTEFINDYLTKSKTDDEIRYAIESLAKFRGVPVDVAQLMLEMEEARKPDDLEIRNRLVRNCFSSVFHDQYVSLYNTRRGALVELTIKGQTSRLMLRKERVSLKQKFEIEHPAYYIDTPELLRNINDAWMECQGSGLGESLVKAIRRGILDQKNNRLSAVSDIASTARLEDILAGFSDVFQDGMQNDGVRNIVYKDKRFKDALELDNLSEGLKSFGLILTAIRYQAIKPGDVLILDEPEIHLHPEWQLRYAELIVLLQKAFKLTVLLTSHSPDFIQALRLYARKHGTSSVVNAYISMVNDNGLAKFVEVDHDNWDEIFQRFMRPVDRLSELEARYGDK